MENMIKKTIFILLLCAILTACVSNSGEPDPIAVLKEQTNPAVNGQVNPSAIATDTYQVNAIRNYEPIFTLNPGEVFDGNAMVSFLTALETDKQQFTVNGVSYHIDPLGEHSYRIYRLNLVAEALLGHIQAVEGVLMSVEFAEAIETALANDTRFFEHKGIVYVTSEHRKVTQISTLRDAVIASPYYLEAYDAGFNEIAQSYKFRLALELALAMGEKTFSYEGERYGVLPVAGGYTITDPEVKLLAELSNIYVIPRGSNATIPLAFKNVVREAIETEKASFIYTSPSGVETEYQVDKLENAWSITPVDTP